MVIGDTKGSDRSFQAFILRLHTEVCDLLFLSGELHELQISLIITDHNMFIAVYIR